MVLALHGTQLFSVGAGCCIDINGDIFVVLEKKKKKRCEEEKMSQSETLTIEEKDKRVCESNRTHKKGFISLQSDCKLKSLL